MKRHIKNYLTLFLITAVVVLLDQLTKTWIRNNLALGSSWAPIEGLAPYFRLVYWYNTGVAFGMFQGQGDIFTILAILIAAAIIYYYPKAAEEDWTLRLAMGLQLGGALGNLVDRLTVGHVIDFISIGRFPVFNVADSSITVGVGVLLLGVYLQDRKNKRERQEEKGIDSAGEAMNDEETH